MKIEMLTTYYRGRTTFMELMNMPLDYIATFYNIAIERQKAEQKKREQEEAEGKNPSMGEAEALALEDEMEAAFT